jgi:1-acyl-sn-glycerol-3-phosphate acyltransferase
MKGAGPGGGYSLVRALTRLLLRLFYARIEVVGAENVPATGPLIVAANHHNSIVDAMLLMAWCAAATLAPGLDRWLAHLLDAG